MPAQKRQREEQASSPLRTKKHRTDTTQALLSIFTQRNFDKLNYLFDNSFTSEEFSKFGFEEYRTNLLASKEIKELFVSIKKSAEALDESMSEKSFGRQFLEQFQKLRFDHLKRLRNGYILNLLFPRDRNQKPLLTIEEFSKFEDWQISYFEWDQGIRILLYGNKLSIKEYLALEKSHGKALRKSEIRNIIFPENSTQKPLLTFEQFLKLPINDHMVLSVLSLASQFASKGEERFAQELTDIVIQHDELNKFIYSENTGKFSDQIKTIAFFREHSKLLKNPGSKEMKEAFLRIEPSTLRDRIRNILHKMGGYSFLSKNHITLGFEVEYSGVPKIYKDLLEETMNLIQLGWNHPGDESVTASKDGYEGEMTSPVISTDAELADACTNVALLQAVGGDIDKSCGFHVHIGVKNIETPEEFKEIAGRYVNDTGKYYKNSFKEYTRYQLEFIKQFILIYKREEEKFKLIERNYNDHQREIKIGCNLFLMPFPESNKYRNSDLKNLYLYTDASGEIFYFKNKYELCLMSPNAVVEKNKIYIQQTEDGFLSYTVITPTNEKVTVITNIPAPEPFSLDTLNELKPQIFERTLKAGHTQRESKKILLEDNENKISSDIKELLIFNQPENSLIPCNDLNILNAVLSITSKRGHTLETNIKYINQLTDIAEIINPPIKDKESPRYYEINSFSIEKNATLEARRFTGTTEETLAYGILSEISAIAEEAKVRTDAFFYEELGKTKNIHESKNKENFFMNILFAERKTRNITELFKLKVNPWQESELIGIPQLTNSNKEIKCIVDTKGKEKKETIKIKDDKRFDDIIDKLKNKKPLDKKEKNQILLELAQQKNGIIISHRVEKTIEILDSANRMNH